MVKKILPAIVLLISLSSCSTFKTLHFTSSKPVAPSQVTTADTRFIDDISLTVSPIKESVPVAKTETKESAKVSAPSKSAGGAARQQSKPVQDVFVERPAEVESATEVQLKYAILMDTEVESLPERPLLDAVDEWYGVRYRVGGNSKDGIDCSAFAAAVYAATYGLTLPRVSREQYRYCRKVSMTELREGDLVFFNTNGRGVSHVGVYLGNNKFIHASVSRGVMVNDLFESYYLKRFIGAGRIDDKQMLSSN